MLFQRPHRTSLLALLAEDALGGVLPLARVVVDLHLHILAADKPEEHQDVAARGELQELAGVFPPRRHQYSPDAEADADIGEVQQKEEITC